jgi:hypothetical protein
MFSTAMNACFIGESGFTLVDNGSEDEIALLPLGFPGPRSRFGGAGLPVYRLSLRIKSGSEQEFRLKVHSARDSESQFFRLRLAVCTVRPVSVGLADAWLQPAASASRGCISRTC